MTRARISELARTTYQGFNDTHLAEMLARDEGILIGRSTLQRLLRAEGIPAARSRRPPRYRSRRDRMAQAGLMVQVDGSRHDWLEGRGPVLTLIAGIDDASGVIVAATFRETSGCGRLSGDPPRDGPPLRPPGRALPRSGGDLRPDPLLRAPVGRGGDPGRAGPRRAS